MDRNREARRASIVGSNGFKRRRHRTSSLRGSPDEDLGVELQESIRLRDRLRSDRDRERERDLREKDRGRDSRERDSRSKRRRAERLMNNRDDAVGVDETSEESVNDEEDDEDDENPGGGGVRLFPPPPSVGSISNHLHHHHHNSHHHHSHTSSGLTQQHDNNASNIIPANHHHLQTRKTIHPSITSSSKAFKTGGPVWKPGDEMIGVSVPRKARSACAKRSHDRISGGGGNNISGGGVVGAEPILPQASSSPVRQGGLASTSGPSLAAPVSPSSSNASVRKKLRLNSGPKLKPPKVSSKLSSSNPEELEIEIAEVLYGLKTHSQSPSLKKEDSREVNRSSSDTKSHVSSPISNSASANNLNLTINSSPLSTVAPKRKRPRQVLENSGYGARCSPVFAKPEMEQAPKSEISSPKLDKIPGSTAENGFETGCDLVNSQGQQQQHLLELKAPESVKIDSESKSTAEESKNKADLVQQEEMRTEDSGREDSNLTATASAAVTMIKASLMSSETENQREEKFVIDLMAPAPLVRSSPEKETKVDLAGSDQKRDLSMADAELKSMMLRDKEEEKAKRGKDQLANVTGEVIKGEKTAEENELLKPFENKGRNLDLQLDFEKFERDGGNKLQHPVSKQPQMPVKVAKEETATGKPGQLASSLPLPLSMATWPGGIPPPMGYMAPLQGVVSMDGSTVTPTPIQPPSFSQPRPKRCATHCFVARNINYFQQVMKMNPFWQAASGSASLFGSKTANMNAVTVTDLLGNNAVRGANNSGVPEKGQTLAGISSPGGKEKNSQSVNSSESAHRKQQKQIMLQQALPPVAAPSNLVGPAFIFPLNQQQAAAAAAAAAASARPTVAKSRPAANQASPNASRPTSGSAPVTSGGASTPMSFNYPNVATNETQYLAILQNNAYPFPIPAVGAPPSYRGTPAQAMPLFNGPFYSSQMIHPSQLQHQQQPVSQSPQLQQSHQNASASSGLSSSQKHLSGQQIRPPSGGATGLAGSPNFPAQKSQSSQQIQQAHTQHISSTRPRLVDNEIGGEESPSTTDNRGSWASVNIYGQNFAMPIHPQNFALMAPPVLASAVASPVAPAVAVSNSDKKPPQQTQHQKSKGGGDSLPPHSFAMSFGTINGNASPAIDIASMTPNHAVFQNFPDATRQNIQMVAAVAAAQAAQIKNFRISEDGKPGGGDSISVDAERKGSSGKVGIAQSIAFTRSDMADTPVSSIPANSGYDSSGRSLNTTGSARSSQPGMANNAGVGNVQNAHIQVQLQQQQMLQIKQQQQLAATRKAPTTSNGNVYSDHLNSPSSMSAKFTNQLSGFPQNIVQSNSSSPTQSPQWKNPTRTAISQAPSPLATSTVSTLKSHPQQHSRAQPPMHTQISFGGNQKTPSSAQGQAPLNSNQAPSPPMMVSSPTTSSISKGSSGSPRTTTNAPSSNKMGQASSLSAQTIKNPASIPTQKSPSILGNPQLVSSPSSGAKPHIQQQQPHQQQLPRNMQQAQLFFSNPFSQVQTTHPTSTSTTTSVPSGYYVPRRRPDQQNQPPQQLPNAPPTSTGVLSLSSSVTTSSMATNDPAKAIAAATCNVKGGGLTPQGVIHAAQLAAQSAGTLLPVGFSYAAHPMPAAVQTKPSEHKQSAGNDNLQQWQPEKK